MDLSPDWVVGFTDGEGCFFVGINPNPQTVTGYQVLPEFTIVQHKRDIQVLYALKRFFGAVWFAQS
jgi:LAGLIDADG endonuclease.